jgi:hypothetical protein
MRMTSDVRSRVDEYIQRGRDRYPSYFQIRRVCYVCNPGWVRGKHYASISETRMPVTFVAVLFAFRASDVINRPQFNLGEAANYWP